MTFLPLFVFLLLLALPGRDCRAEENQGALEKVRIGYVESEEYAGFTEVLLDIGRELALEGSISKDFVEKYKDVNFEEKMESGDTQILWEDLCDALTPGARYCFVREAFFNMTYMDEQELEEVAGREDVDLMLAMGTAPGVYLREHETKNKFMVIYAGDPIASGIVKSETERYIPNSFATIDNTAYDRQIEAGKKFLEFERLGVVYEDSPEAYVYSAIEVVERKAQELGFEVFYENVDEPKNDEDYDRFYRELKEAYRRLVEKGIDALYLTVSSIDYEEKMQELLDDSLIPGGVKTLAQDEILPVKYGVLFGVTQTDDAEVASHVVTQLRAWAEEGVPFDELDMVCECTPKIAVNYSTAKKIGFHLSMEDLQLVDFVFRDEADHKEQ